MSNWLDKEKIKKKPFMTKEGDLIDVPKKIYSKTEVEVVEVWKACKMVFEN